MGKPVAALILSVFSLFLSFAVGEPLTYRFGATGLIPAFAVLLAYFFVCQFFLSRGNTAVFRRNWPSMLALVSVPIVLAIVIGVQWENNGAVFWTQGIGLLVSSFGGSLAGAFAASQAARRKR